MNFEPSGPDARSARRRTAKKKGETDAKSIACRAGRCNIFLLSPFFARFFRAGKAARRRSGKTLPVAPTPGRVSKGRAGALPLVGQERGFSRRGPNRKGSLLERVFAYFLHEQKVPKDAPKPLRFWNPAIDPRKNSRKPDRRTGSNVSASFARRAFPKSAVCPALLRPRLRRVQAAAFLAPPPGGFPKGGPGPSLWSVRREDFQGEDPIERVLSLNVSLRTFCTSRKYVAPAGAKPSPRLPTRNPPHPANPSKNPCIFPKGMLCSCC